MDYKLTARAITATLALVFAQVAFAQTADELRALGKDVEAIKASQAAMQKELAEIKGLLQGAIQPQAAAAPAGPTSAIEQTNISLSLAGAPVLGENNAKVTLLEFTDYQCPFCSRHFRQTWPQIEQDYVKTGKVKLVLRDMPLEQIHPLAQKAAEAARCAGDQGKYWEMHDRLFSNQTTLARKDLSGHAQAVGLDVKEFDKCVDSSKQATRVRTDTIDATRATARGTPIFFLRLTQPNSLELKAVKVIRGNQSYSVFKEAIDGLLASAN